MRTSLGLTAHEHFVLARLMSDSSRQRSGNDPWERSWQRAYNSKDGRAMASLARQGLIQCDRRGESPRYRWRKEP